MPESQGREHRGKTKAEIELAATSQGAPRTAGHWPFPEARRDSNLQIKENTVLPLDFSSQSREAVHSIPFYSGLRKWRHPPTSSMSSCPDVVENYNIYLIQCPFFERNA